jgi:hypothetical protein
MKHLQIPILVLLLFLTNFSLAQPICDTLSSELTKQFDNYSKKDFRKLRKQKKLAPIKAFEIATYFRQKGDTTYKQWYSLVISQFVKYPYYYGDKMSSIKAPYLLFYIAQSYYFTIDYEQAYKWYIRIYKTNIPQPCKCLDDNFEEVKRKLGKTE